MSERTLAVKVNLTAFNRLTAPFEAAQRSTAALSGGLRTTQHHLKDLTQQARAFDTLTAKTDKQTASYEQAKQRVKSLTAAYPALRHQTDTQKKALADARKARQNAGRELDRQKKKLNAVRGALYRHGISARKGADVTGQLTRRTEAYNRTLSTQKQRLEAVTRAQRRYSDAKKTRDRLMSGGAKATAAGAGLLYGTGKLIAPGRGFGAQMSKVQALLDLNKEDAALAGLRAQARQMGASTRYTATDAATAQSVLAAAGLTPEAIRASLKAVLNLADAGGIGLEESAGLGATVANQFELPASQMGRISDTLVKTAKSADTNLTILAESFRKAGSAAHMAGLSVEETGVLFDSMADAGIKGAPAGTAVSQMLNSLITPSEKGKKALDQLGISVRDQTGRMKDFRVIAGELGQAMQGFDRAGQMQILTELFGGSAIVKSGSLAVIKALHSGKFDRLLADNLKAAGVAAKDAAVMADNLDGDLLTLRSAWEDLGIELSDNVDPPLRRVTQTLTGVVSGVKNWMKSHPQLTQALMLSGLAAGTLAAGFGTLAMAAASVLVPFAALRLSASLLGIRGFGALLRPLRWLLPGLSRLAGGLKAPLAPLKQWGPLLNRVKKSAAGLMNSLSGAGSRLVRVARTAGRGLGVAFLHPLKSLGRLGKGITALGSRGFGGLHRAGGTVFRVLLTGLAALFTPAGLLIAALVTGAVLIYKYWEPVKAFFTGFFQGLTEALSPLAEAFKQAFAWLAPVFEGIWKGIKKVWEWLTSLFTPVQQSEEALRNCTEAGKTFGRVVGEAISALLTPVRLVGEGIGWILEKLNLVPAAAKQAVAEIDELEQAKNRTAALADPASPQGAGALIGNLTRNALTLTAAGGKSGTETTPAAGSAETGTGDNKTDNSGSGGKWGYGNKPFALNDGKDSAMGAAAAAQPDPDKPGAIVFKHRPPVMPVRGLYQEPRVMQTPPVPTLPRAEKMALPSAASVAAPSAHTETTVFNLHFHGVNMDRAKDLARLVKREIEKLQTEAARKRRSCFSERGMSQ